MEDLEKEQDRPEEEGVLLGREGGRREESVGLLEEGKVWLAEALEHKLDLEEESVGTELGSPPAASGARTGRGGDVKKRSGERDAGGGTDDLKMP